MRSSSIKCGILFMDIKGYSKLPQDKKGQIHNFINDIYSEFSQISIPAGFPQGEETIKGFNTWGDAIIALFTRPKYAIDGLRKLEGKFKDLPGKLGVKLNMRIVMHAGNVNYFDSVSYFGDSIITAARIEPLVSPGEVWFSSDFRDWVNESIKSYDTGNDVVKDDLKNELNKFDDGSWYLLPKNWGAQYIYRYRKPEITNEPKTYLKVKFKWNEELEIISFGGFEVVKEPFAGEQRTKILKKMEKFLKNEISEVEACCAIGMQNFLELNGELCIGVRLKTDDNKELRDYELIAKECFNTGYKLIRNEGDLPQHANGAQNLFERVQKTPGKPLTKEHLDELTNKLIPIYKIMIGDSLSSAMININYSWFFPRFEIGFCQYYDTSIPYEDNQKQDFGADKYGETEDTYWLWVRQGEIKAFSFYKIKGFEGKNILLLNVFHNNRYTPFISDEILGGKVTINQFFSSPARSVLEKF